MGQHPPIEGWEPLNLSDPLALSMVVAETREGKLLSQGHLDVNGRTYLEPDPLAPCPST
jgi:hypothetical protein